MSGMSGMGCEEKDRLLAEYSRASLTFSDAVAELQRKTGTSTKPEYETLRRAADDARMKSEQGRLALEEHTARHGC
jgi:hypothetical protein